MSDNSASPLDRFFQVGRVLATAIKGVSDVVLQVSTGIGFDGEEEVLDDVTMWGPFGLIGRALAPERIDGREYICEVLLQRTGAGGVRPVGFRDLRWNRMFPNGLQKGETALVAYGGQVIRLSKDGSVNIVTTDDGTKDGKLVSLQVRRDGISAAGPWGKMTLAQDGFHVLHYSGARIDLNGVGGLPAPFSSLGSMVKISGAVVQLEGSSVTLGPTLGLPEPVVKSVSLQTYLTALEGVITTLAAAVDAKSPPSFGAVSSAIEAALAALQASKVAFASNSTGVGS